MNIIMFRRSLSVELKDLSSREAGVKITCRFLTHTEINDNKNWSESFRVILPYRIWQRIL